MFVCLFRAMPISHYKMKHLRKLTSKEELILAQAFTISRPHCLRGKQNMPAAEHIGTELVTWRPWITELGIWLSTCSSRALRSTQWPSSYWVPWPEDPTTCP